MVGFQIECVSLLTLLHKIVL